MALLRFDILEGHGDQEVAALPDASHRVMVGASTRFSATFNRMVECPTKEENNNGDKAKRFAAFP